MKPIQCFVGQVVKAVLGCTDSTRLALVVKNWRDGGKIYVLTAWNSEPVDAYYATEIVPDESLPPKLLEWVNEQRKSWEKYWQMMEMPRLKVLNNVVITEVPGGSI